MAQYDGKGAAFYEGANSVPQDFVDIEIHNFQSILGDVRGKRVLDLACGFGRWTQILRDSGAHACGSDVSPDQIDIARQLSPDIEYFVLDARDREYLAETGFDLITAVYLLHYAETHEQLRDMLALVYRNLAPGGRFVTLNLNPDYDPELANKSEWLTKTGLYVGKASAESNRLALEIGGMRADTWQWERTTYERTMFKLGFADIAWHPLSELPTGPQSRADSWRFFLQNPNCIALSAYRPR